MKVWKVKTVCCKNDSELENKLNSLELSGRKVKEIIKKYDNNDYYQIIYIEEDIMEVNNT